MFHNRCIRTDCDGLCQKHACRIHVYRLSFSDPKIIAKNKRFRALKIWPTVFMSSCLFIHGLLFILLPFFYPYFFFVLIKSIRIELKESIGFNKHRHIYSIYCTYNVYVDIKRYFFTMPLKRLMVMRWCWKQKKDISTICRGTFLTCGRRCQQSGAQTY